MGPLLCATQNTHAAEEKYIRCKYTYLLHQKCYALSEEYAMLGEKYYALEKNMKYAMLEKYWALQRICYALEMKMFRQKHDTKLQAEGKNASKLLCRRIYII
jgi:hypothetical protein